MKMVRVWGRSGFILVIVFSLFLTSVSTYAISEKLERKYSRYNIYFYNPCSTTSSSTVGGIGTGSGEEIFVDAGDNATTIMSNLVNAGYTKEAAAAILGNLQAESTLNPRKFEGGDLADDNFRAWNGGKTFKNGFGLVQWTTDNRVKALQEYADRHNLPVISLQAQVGYMIEELASYGYGPGVLNGYELDEAVFIIARHYESPGAMIWIDHKNSKGETIHYNDRIPDLFSELDPVETAGAYEEWKKRNDYAAVMLGVEPTDLPGEVIVDETNTYSEECGEEGEEGEEGGSEEGSGIDVINIDGIISFLQCDPRWGNLMYGSEGINGTKGKTICNSGCGPTSFASILATMGFNVTPADVADVAGRAGMYEYGVGSSHQITRVLAEHYGLTYQGINPKSVDQINSLLHSGYMVHIVGKGSLPFSPGGHYVAIMGVDSNGNWIVADSGHGQNKAIASYPPNVIVSGASAGGAVKK